MPEKNMSLVSDDPPTAIYPIQFVQVDALYNVPAPLVRVSTCGGLTVEVLQTIISSDPPQGKYQAVTPQQRRKGSTTGRNLLNVLVSLPGHYAAKGWLMEKLCRNKDDDEDSWGGMVRVDNIVTLLRGLLCPPGIAGEQILRKALVTFLPNRFESGPGYQLATEPLLWLDVDVIEASVKQACLFERSGKDALPAWEQAYILAGRGSYLPDEPYSDWARDKRSEVDGYLRQAVHALHRLYLARDGEIGEEQVLLLLRSYWQSHPSDEDVLRPLLELLGKRDCVQEAEEYYQRLCTQLELEGNIPSQRTRQTFQNLRIGQKRDEQVSPHIEETVLSLSITSAKKTDLQDEIFAAAAPQLQEVLSMLSVAISQNIMMVVQDLERINMDIVRRDFLHMLGTSLVLAGLSNEVRPFIHTMLNGDQMALLETEVAKRWSVYHSGDTIQAHENLHLWLAEVERFAKGATSRLQSTHAYSLLSRSYQLQGSIFRDKMDYTQAHNFYKKAFLAADEFGNSELKSSSLARRGVTFIQQQKPLDAIQYLEGALIPIDDLDFPYLKGYIFQALSEAYAMEQHHEQSQRNLDLAEQVLACRNNVIESSNCQMNTTSVIAQKGVNSVLLQDYAHALDLLNRGLDTYAPSLLRGRARLIAQKAEAYYGLGYIDKSTSTAKDAFDIAHSIGSQKTISRVKKLYTLLEKSPYGKEKSVIQLGMMLAIN